MCFKIPFRNPTQPVCVHSANALEVNGPEGTACWAQVGEVLLPAPVVGHPMTYSVNGRQHIIVGVSGGNYTGEYISLRLPQTEVPSTAPRQ